MASDLYANLADLEGTPQAEAILDELATGGLEDMGLHFLPWCNMWLQDRCMCSMSRDGQEVRSRTDYILRTDHRLFQDMDVQDPLQNSDHYMVLGCLWGRR